jgi:hypothetical protein
MAKKTSKPHWEMNTAELAAATREFDQEFVPTKPLSAADKALHRRARQKAATHSRNNGKRNGRARTASRRIVVAVEPDLLRRTDAFAKSHGITRSQLVARGLAAIVGDR